MLKKQYNILLAETIMVTTELEKADAPMGVVFGRISFININSCCDFIKPCCVRNNITLAGYPKDGRFAFYLSFIIAEYILLRPNADGI